MSSNRDVSVQLARTYSRACDRLDLVRSFRRSVPVVTEVDVSWASGRAVSGYKELAELVSADVTQNIANYFISAEQQCVNDVKRALYDLRQALVGVNEV